MKELILIQDNDNYIIAPKTTSSVVDVMMGGCTSVHNVEICVYNFAGVNVAKIKVNATGDIEIKKLNYR